MSFDIDMSTYGSGANQTPADAVDTNFYQQEASDSLYGLETQGEVPPSEEVTPEPSRQELNFQALRGEVDRIKAEKEAQRAEYQLQLDMLRANMMQQQASVPQPKPKEMFDGLDKDYVPNVDEIRREWSQKEANYQARLEELEFQTAHPDYAEVMEKYAIPLVRQKPHLADGLRGATNKALFAYELGKMAQQLQTREAEAPQVSQTAQRIVENSRRPGHVSQVGGQAALSKADYFATMSDAEFHKIASRNLEGI